MDTYTYALLVVAVITIGAYLLLPRDYRHYAILIPLLIVFIIVILDLFRAFGFSFKTVALILVGIIVVAASVVVRMRW